METFSMNAVFAAVMALLRAHAIAMAHSQLLVTIATGHV